MTARIAFRNPRKTKMSKRTSSIDGLSFRLYGRIVITRAARRRERTSGPGAGLISKAGGTNLTLEDYMKRIISGILTMVFVFGLGVASMAQTATTPRIDRREQRQRTRIRRGVRSGELNRREARRLARQQARTRRQEAIAKADGKVTRRERRHLNRRENRTSRRIYRQKHDAQTRRP